MFLIALLFLYTGRSMCGDCHFVLRKEVNQPFSPGVGGGGHGLLALTLSAEEQYVISPLVYLKT